MLKYLIKCERKRNKDIKDLFSLVINSKQHLEEQVTPPIASTFAAAMEVAAKFRKFRGRRKYYCVSGRFSSSSKHLLRKLMPIVS